MIGAFLFYLVRDLRNRIHAAIKRLRRPKYLISALAGLAYLYLIFLRNFFSQPSRRPQFPLPPQADLLPVVEAAGAFAILFMVILPWLWPGRGGGLRFAEAEIQFLFPAPVSRRALVHFRLIKMQFGIWFGVLISFAIFGRGGYFDHPVYLALTFWIVYSFLGLCNVATSLVQTSLAHHGISGFKRQGWVLVLLLALAASVGVWARYWLVPMPEAGPGGLSEAWAWIARLTESGPAYYFLYPFRALVRPAFASEPAAFLLRLGPALAVVALAYAWVMWTDVSFEEASLERARKTAMRLDAARSGSWRARPRMVKVRRPLFRLKPLGMPHTAILWKNLISVGRLATMRVIPVLLAVGIGLAVVFSRKGGSGIMPTMVASMAMTFAAIMTLMGPVLVRDDLRSDLLQIDLLKTYPVSGWRMVLGQVLAPAAVIAAFQWVLILVAALIMPGQGRFLSSPAQRMELALTAAFLLPCFSLMGVLIHNAAALLWPGWVELGKMNRQGVEAIGQRIITMLGAMIALVLSLVPAGIVFAAVFLSGSWLIGMAILPVAALAAALALLAESAFAIAWLGRLYDRFDPSRM